MMEPSLKSLRKGQITKIIPFYITLDINSPAAAVLHKWDLTDYRMVIQSYTTRFLYDAIIAKLFAIPKK